MQETEIIYRETFHRFKKACRTFNIFQWLNAQKQTDVSCDNEEGFKNKSL